ncbi:MAG: hypothetical protein GY793_08475 [Proteobacteria bacterium]|nr:hypothetical protein [Pseudomonadota bacterium]
MDYSQAQNGGGNTAYVFEQNTILPFKFNVRPESIQPFVQSKFIQKDTGMEYAFTNFMLEVAIGEHKGKRVYDSFTQYTNNENVKWAQERASSMIKALLESCLNAHLDSSKYMLQELQNNDADLRALNDKICIVKLGVETDQYGNERNKVIEVLSPADHSKSKTEFTKYMNAYTQKVNGVQESASAPNFPDKDNAASYEMQKPQNQQSQQASQEPNFDDDIPF